MLNKKQFFFIYFFMLIAEAELSPNIVLFITDDQDIFLGGMSPMLKTKKLLKNEGTFFYNAFASSPVCCPSRASILTGLYQHNHNVLNNSLEGGCSSLHWQETFEKETFAVHLKKQGYSTFYAGKYLNKYGADIAGGPHHVPPGWDSWIGLVGNSKYYNYTLSVNGKRKYFSKNYLTRLLQSYAYNFIKLQKNSSQPFLMVIAPPAPHYPFTPEPKYMGYFEGERVPRNVQFNFGNNSKKHWLLQMKPLPLPLHTLNLLDKMHARRWETLMSVDDMIESIINHLDAIKKLHNTYLFLTSDNGFHLGQFSLTWDKRQMYEFDIRVPLLVRGPGVPKNLSHSDPVTLVDLAPTLLYISGIKDTNLDGESFLPVKNRKGRTFLIEYHGEGFLDKNSIDCGLMDKHLYHCVRIAECKCQDAKNNTYSCVRHISHGKDFIYCQFMDQDDFEELYDIKSDGFQLNNIITHVSQLCKQEIKLILNELLSCKSECCHEIHNYNFKYCLYHPIMNVG